MELECAKTICLVPCVLCRQNDTLYVWPEAMQANGPTKRGGNGSVELSLERDGVPVPGDFSLFPKYTLGAETATYTLRTVYHNSFSGNQFGKKVSTDWTFRSGRVETDNVNKPYICARKYFGGRGLCGWQPFI